MMPVFFYLGQLVQGVGAFFSGNGKTGSRWAEQECQLHPSIALLRHAFFFHMSPTFDFVQAQNSCVAQKVWSLKSKDVMSCPHMKVVWGGGVGMEMQSD